MPKTIEAIYENGVFKPLKKINLPEHKRLTIIVPDKTEQRGKRKCSLNGIIDLAKDCSDTDLSVYHDKYLYGATDN
ncbi:MAG: antitoxin family protein [Nitrospirae bacterium]|nr:antitoxin family protein [Nitrospirota bacterium]